MSEIDFACDGERSKNRLRAAKSDTEHTLERTERPQFSYSKYLYARIALFQFKRNIGRPRRARWSFYPSHQCGRHSAPKL